MILQSGFSARATAEAVAKGLNYDIQNLDINPALYEATLVDLLAIIQKLEDDWNSALLFGHNMTYTFFVNDNIPSPTKVCSFSSEIFFKLYSVKVLFIA